MMDQFEKWMTRELHEQAMDRIKEVTGCSTQMQLAEALGVRQSSISDAKRRASIPAGWLLTLVRRPWRVNPDWILTGLGPRNVACVDGEANAEDLSAPRDVSELTRLRAERALAEIERQMREVRSCFRPEARAEAVGGI